jgi:hypothetical protein
VNSRKVKRISDFSQRALIRLRQKTNFGRTSYPFISGDAFRHLADHSIATCEDLLSISDPKVLFMSSELHEHIPRVLDSFPSLQVLIVGNGDTNFSREVFMGNNLQLVLCQNLLGSNFDGLRFIPIGLENRRLGKSGLQRYFQHHSHEQLSTRIFKVLIPPMSPTNSLREKIDLDSYGFTKSNFDMFGVYLPVKSYFQLVRKYRFILCLEGNGFDTHRLWEALYLECFPVVLNSPWSQELKELGMPILVVDKLSDITVEVLLQFEKENRGFCSLQTPQLWMPYWEKLVSEASK